MLSAQIVEFLNSKVNKAHNDVVKHGNLFTNIHFRFKNHNYEWKFTVAKHPIGSNTGYAAEDHGKTEVVFEQCTMCLPCYVGKPIKNYVEPFCFSTLEEFQAKFDELVDFGDRVLAQ